MPDLAEPAANAADSEASALAARVEADWRGQVVVDYANRGVPIPEIAARLGVSEAEAREKLRAALVRALPETPEMFAALQMSRLNEALLVAFAAMTDMGLKAVDRVLRIVRALDRLHAAARPLALVVGGADGDAPAALAPPSARGPAAPRERNQIAAQPVEKSENRSQNLERPATSAEAAAPGDGTAPGRGERGDGLARRFDSPGPEPDRPEPAARPGERSVSPVLRATPPRYGTFGAIRPGAASVHALAAAGA